MYILNEKGFFLFEDSGDFYQYKTEIAPPFEEFPRKEFDYQFNFKTEKWIAISKPKYQMVHEAKRKIEKKILKKSSYNNEGGVKTLILKKE